MKASDGPGSWLVVPATASALRMSFSRSSLVNCAASNTCSFHILSAHTANGVSLLVQESGQKAVARLTGDKSGNEHEARVHLNVEVAIFSRLDEAESNNLREGRW